MNLIARFSYALSLALLVLLTACSKDDEPTAPQFDMVGTWKLTDARLNFPEDTDVRAFYREYFEGLNIPDLDVDEAVNDAVASYEASAIDLFPDPFIYDFQADGVATITEDDETEEGTWEVIEGDSLQLTINTDVSQRKIASLTNDELAIQVGYYDIFPEEFNDFTGFRPPAGTLYLLTFAKQP